MNKVAISIGGVSGINYQLPKIVKNNYHIMFYNSSADSVKDLLKI